MVADSGLTIRPRVPRARNPFRALPAVLLFGAATTACTHLPARERGLPIRVMTYNIRSGNGDLARVAAIIRGFSPDLVGLQEVDVHWGERSAFADQARLLGEMLHMSVRFAPIYTLSGADSTKPVRQFGVALLSKYAVSEWKNDTLTRLSTQVQNPVPAPAPGLLEATIDVEGTAVRVFNTHLDYRADPAVRKQQVAEMVAQISASPGPMLVLGDMNAGPEAPELEPLLKRLRDSWQTKTDPGFTYPADKPAKRIDYVLTSNHFLVRAASVPATEASDHRPVLVDLLLIR